MKIKELALILVAAVLPQVALAQQSKSDPSVEFNPYLYGQVQAGLGATIGETPTSFILSPVAAALSVGYQFSAPVGVRLGLTGWQGKGYVVQETEQPNYKFNYAQAHLDVTLSLLNLFGYDSKYKLNPYLFVGGGGLYAFNNGANDLPVKDGNFDYLYDTKFMWLLRTGLGVDYNVTDRLAVGLEANVNSIDDHFNSKRGSHYDYQYQLMLGAKYAFGPTTRRSEKYEAEQAAAAAALAAIEAERARANAEIAAAKKAAEDAAAAKIAEVEAARKALEEQAAEKAKSLMARYTFFDINSTVISESEAYRLNEFAEWLKANPEQTVSVVGYADVNTGNARINMRLSEGRAKAVAAYLVEQGVDAARITTSWLGDKVQPFSDDFTKNRVAISSLRQ